jgi:hypothetical protein
VSTAALTTVAAVAATTAAVAIAVAATATVLDNTLAGTDTSIPVSIELGDVRELSDTIVSTLENLTLDRLYYFAYLDWSVGLIINRIVPLNYLEAYAVLFLCGLINTADLGALESGVRNLNLSDSIKDLIDVINDKDFTGTFFGIYADTEADAAKLAYAAGGFFHGPQSEIHNKTKGSGYYYHFHDFHNIIHVWYGSPA